MLRPTRGELSSLHPGDLRRTTAEVNNPSVLELYAVGHRQGPVGRFLLRIDYRDVEPEGSNPIDELGAIRGLSSGAGGKDGQVRQMSIASVVTEQAKHGDRPIHRRFRQGARCRQALRQPGRLAYLIDETVGFLGLTGIHDEPGGVRTHVDDADALHTA